MLMRNDYDAPEGETFDEIYQSDGLRWMSIVVVLLVVLGFFSLAWYAYRTNTTAGGEEGEILIVEGDTLPYKQRPENPGGMQFPNQDKEVYNKLVAEDEKATHNTVERLLPPPEEPVTRPQPTEEAAADEEEKKPTSWINSKLHQEPKEEMEEKLEVVEAPAQQAAPQEAKKTEDAAPEVREQRKAEVTPQQKIPAYVPPKPVVKPWMPVEKTQEAVKEDVTEAPAKAPAAADPIVAQAEKFVQEKQVKTPVSPPSAPAAPAAAPAAGNVEVQLAALRSKAEAESLWQKLLARHRDLLSGKSHRIVTAEIAGKGTFYRLRVGTSSPAAATSLCASLTQRNQACILAR